MQNFLILVRRRGFLAAPPSTQGGAKRDGVGEALRFGLHAREGGVQIGALRIHDDELRDAAEFLPQADLVEIALCGAFGVARAVRPRT